MSRPVSIAACQFVIKPVKDFDGFAKQVCKLLDQAKGADLVLFPELFTLALFTTFEDWRNRPLRELVKVDRYTKAYRAFFADEAKRRGQHIVAGSHLEKKNGGYLNVAYVYGPNGLVHMLPFARVGFNVCYESEIPECAATLTEQGAEIILCPSFTFTEYGFWRVRHCAQARCIENQVYFVHCATGGKLPKGPLPNGWTRSPRGPGIAWDPAHGTVDLDLIHQNRNTGVAPTFRDRRRRADCYRSWPSHLDRKPARRLRSVGKA